MMKSPCIAACKNEGGICIGCKRTIKEVIEWKALGDDGREKIMKVLKGEDATHGCPECNKPAQCDIQLGKDTCWCFELEEREIEQSSTNSTCLCRECLSKKPIA